MPRAGPRQSGTPGAKVPRRFLTVLGGDRAAFRQGSGRLELARAIASPDNPLTARVMVNRVWQHHFGRGLVGTASNFGALGERPSHPELLDWLARRFVESGWSLKALHREIMLSATYRQSSRFDSQGRRQGPGQHPALADEPPPAGRRGLARRHAGRRRPARSSRSAVRRSASMRRAIAAAPLMRPISRHDLAWMLRLFDFPDPNITSGGRVETTVPLQQLFVLNSEFMVDGRPGRRRPAATGPARPPRDDAARIRRAYLLLYGREATAARARARPGVPPRRRSSPTARPDSPARRATATDAEPLGALCPGPAGGRIEFLFVD